MLLHSSEIEKHNNQCIYNMVLCPNNYCSHKTFKINMNSHLRKCNFQRVCPYCKKEMASKKFPFHRKVCKLREVLCKLCKKYLSFYDYREHIESCKSKYLTIIRDLKTCKMLCSYCYETNGQIICDKLDKMKGCHICSSLYCNTCYFVKGIQCKGCQKVTCQSHLKLCWICKVRKCKNCISKCSNCKKGVTCYTCLNKETTSKSYCNKCHRCPCGNRINSKKSCFYCNQTSLCENCLVISSVSNKLICKNKTILCTTCDFKFHDQEIKKIIMLLNLKLNNTLKFIKMKILSLISCEHTLDY